MQIIVTLFLSSIAILAITHILALEFYLYWRFLWLDIPMHILGGICVAFGLASLPYFGVHLPKRFTTFVSYLILVLLAGLSWEVFEFVTGQSLTGEKSFLLDTTIDLILSLVGVAFGYYLITRLKDL